LDKISDALTTELRLVIADEINIACAMGLLSQDDLLAWLKNAKNCGTGFTGRVRSLKLYFKGDLVTEMKEYPPHYAEKGFKARVGIER
jgi:cob(I)alamin adenosyltransferase